jgi:two-component system response regulator YesN
MGGNNMYRAYFIDDEPAVLENLIKNPLFNNCGYVVIGFSSNPQQAIGDIRKLNPDVVFTDLKMPGLTGVELMEKLRDCGSDCEFVIISAYGEFESTRRFFKNKGFDYLLKPVSDEDLQTLLDNLSGRLAGKKNASGATNETIVSSTGSPELDNVIAYLKSNLAVRYSLEYLSGKFGMHTTYICDLFSNNLGTTYSSYMTRLRMQAAAGLLKETSKNVKEIAKLCGYEYLYFVQVFKKYYACTPTMFRNERGYE